MKVLTGLVDPKSVIAKRTFGELQPSFGDFKQQGSVMWLCLFGKPDAFIGAAGIIYPSVHGHTEGSGTLSVEDARTPPAGGSGETLSSASHASRRRQACLRPQCGQYVYTRASGNRA